MQKRKPLSAETKRKISKSHLGKTLSPDHIQKMREAHLGEVSEVSNVRLNSSS